MTITESTSIQITSCVQVVIQGHGKLDYLLGQKQRLDENDLTFQNEMLKILSLWHGWSTQWNQILGRHLF